MLEELTKKMANLEEQDVRALVKKELDAGTDPLAILEAGREGMGIVGKRFEEKEYFVAELMMAAAVFKEVAALVTPKMKAGTAGPSKGIVIFGTVQGDIHDIGKNIVVSMLQANGYDVRDQGVDVPAAKFIAALKESGAKVLGMSGLVTVSYDGMKAVIQALQDAGLRGKVKVMIGGGIINEKVREYTGADAWGKDANQAVTICGQLMGGV